MTNLLRTGATWLAEQVRDHLSDAVTYARGEDAVELQAARGMSTYEIDNGEAVSQVVESHDFIFAAADLVLDGAAAIPQTGDRITDADGKVYQVLAPLGQDVYRADEYSAKFRVHTKLIDTED